jgi:uncharacterized phage protein (TIGR01671 family)
MNREIKFRAWDKARKVLFMIFDNSSLDWYLPTWKDNYEIMQFTGLKDKEGKEIYEGDIIESTSREVTFDGQDTGKIAKDKYEVVWVEENAHYAQKRIKTGYIQSGTGMKQKFMTKYYEVIGNIHENPELVKEIK